MKKLIVISDWAEDTLTCQEVRSSLEGFLKDPTAPNISFVASTPLTIHTSFLMAQVVETEERYGRPLETVIYQNTEPRVSTESSVKDAELMIARLVSGIYICGPNAGYNFSMIKPKIEEVYTYRGLESGSEYKFRDLFTRISAHLMDAMQDNLDLEEISSNTIPELEGFYIGHIDTFGNIKTTIPKEYFKGKYNYDDQITLKINNIEQKARYVNTLSGGTIDEVIIYPGSSGHKDNPFMEITALNSLLPGEKIEIL